MSLNRIGLMYGSTTMNSERVAELIWNKIKETELHDIQDGVEVLEQYENIILVAPTWDYGSLQEHYIEQWEKLQNVNWSNKSVALVGLGDQVGYSDLYQDSMSIIYETIKKLGGKFIGFTNTNGHNFEKSQAIRDGKFVGLAIDEDNQSKLTEERVNNWLQEIRTRWRLR